VVTLVLRATFDTRFETRRRTRCRAIERVQPTDDCVPIAAVARPRVVDLGPRTETERTEAVREYSIWEHEFHQMMRIAWAIIAVAVVFAILVRAGVFS
jgi:hypothetical protein